MTEEYKALKRCTDELSHIINTLDEIRRGTYDDGELYKRYKGSFDYDYRDLIEVHKSFEDIFLLEQLKD